ncbi:MAG: SMC-Scp complex subunit ScpB [Propionibacteriaceae bacterium]|nr:SMC-Scp complex subunit ScpB [Propionibacteriaceae bacterium]
MLTKGRKATVTEAKESISGAVEALLLLAEDPLSEIRLAQALDVGVAEVSACLAELAAFYEETGRGFELRQLAGGWRYYTREEHADLIATYLLDGQQSRLSQAALETLAVVAYQQPISRSRISAIRGVSVDAVIRTLLSRGLIREAGHDDESGAVIFATTSHFLERMGLRSLDELPPLAPHLPDVDELEAELSQLAPEPNQPGPNQPVPDQSGYDDGPSGDEPEDSP